MPADRWKSPSPAISSRRCPPICWNGRPTRRGNCWRAASLQWKDVQPHPAGRRLHADADGRPHVASHRRHGARSDGQSRRGRRPRGRPLRRPPAGRAGGGRRPAASRSPTSTPTAWASRASNRHAPQDQRHLIPRNTPLPAKITERFATKSEGQRSIVIKVLEGESSRPGECTAIGRTVVRDLPAGLPKGWPVEVTFEYGTNGRLSVRPMVPGTHQQAELELERDVGLSSDGIAALDHADFHRRRFRRVRVGDPRVDGGAAPAVAGGSSGILTGRPQPAAAQPAAAQPAAARAAFRRHAAAPAMPPTPSDAWAMPALPPTNPLAPLTPAPLGPPSLGSTMPAPIGPVAADVAAEPPGGGTAPEIAVPLTSRRSAPPQSIRRIFPAARALGSHSISCLPWRGWGAATCCCGGCAGPAFALIPLTPSLSGHRPKVGQERGKLTRKNLVPC